MIKLNWEYLTITIMGLFLAISSLFIYDTSFNMNFIIGIFLMMLGLMTKNRKELEDKIKQLEMKK